MGDHSTIAHATNNFQVMADDSYCPVCTLTEELVLAFSLKLLFTRENNLSNELAVTR